MVSEGFCQAQLQLQLELRLALISYNPAPTHPPTTTRASSERNLNFIYNSNLTELKLGQTQPQLVSTFVTFLGAKAPLELVHVKNNNKKNKKIMEWKIFG